MAKKKKSRRAKKKRRNVQSQAPPPSPDPSSAKKKKAGDKSNGARLPKNKIIPAAAVVVVALAAAALLLFKPKAESPVIRDNQLNVLLITLDTTRADRLGCYGYSGAETPNLDSLARKGVRFANAYCPVPLTLPSHCSILTGTLPTYHHVHNNGTFHLAAGQLTLAEILKSRGYQTAAFVASFTVDSRFGLDQGFDVYDDSFQEESPFKGLNSERKAQDVFASFDTWMNGSGDKPFFCWVHFFDPHLPYLPPSPYKEKFNQKPYDGEIAYMDSYVGAVLDTLEENNLRDNTLIVIAGDHGEELGEKGETGHGIFLYDGAMKVPLLICAGSRLPAGKVISQRVRLIDVLPTVLDMLNLEEEETIQGQSLIPHIEGGNRDDLDAYIETFYPRDNYGWSELIGLISGDWKFIRAPKPELYNLKSDPQEEQNQFQNQRKIVTELSRDLEQLIENSSIPAETAARTLSAEERERLQALGYIGYSGNDLQGELPDPKDRIAELRTIQQAQMFEYAGNFSEAEQLHRQMLSLRPDSPSSYINLALAQARQEKFEEAVATLKQGADRIPGSELLLARLGHTYFVTGRLDEALSTMQQVLALNPDYFDALMVSAVILDTMGRKEAARDYFVRALAIEPENKQVRMSYAMNLATGGELDKAITAFQELIQDYPGEFLLYQHLGIAQGMSGDYFNAIQNLKEAVRLNPTPIAWLNLGLAYQRTGETSEAIRCFEAYLQDPEGEDPGKVESVRRELSKLRRQLP
jgi:arylsulfatase A-like enzyme/Flp pilus assembly protein TadD